MIKNYIFLGAPGVGKGTMAKLISENGPVHISTGDIFRENIKNETELGKQVKSILAAGQYVTDDITNAIVKDRLEKEDVQTRGFILDGYPRTLNQSEFLKANNINITAAVLLDAPDELVIQRLLGRARGEDDTIEVITERLKVYNDQTKPLIDFYTKENLLLKVDATGDIDTNLANLKKALA